MGYGIYDLANAGTNKISQLDAVANNIANASTPGFKAARLHFSLKNDQGTPADGEKSFLSFLSVDFSQGPAQQTGNAMDMAIQGDGFFVIETKTGTAYTRRGSFALNNDHELVTQSGDYVLGSGGRHIVINGGQLEVDGRGTIKVDGSEAGRLRIVVFENIKALQSAGEGVFTDPGNAAPKDLDKPAVASNYLEGANIQVLREMVEMIDIQHSFETYQKAIQTLADLDRLSTSRVGRLA